MATCPVMLDFDRYDAARERGERQRMALSRKQDEIAESLTGADVAEMVFEADVEQVNALFTELLPLLEVEPRYLHKQNVCLIASALQMITAPAIEARARRELGL